MGQLLKTNKINHVVSFSGGRSSAFLVFLMEIARRVYGWNVTYVYCDTGIEHNLSYKFVRDVVKMWGIDLIVLRVKVNPLNVGNGYELFKPSDIQTSKMPYGQPFADLLEVYGTPYSGGEFCSDRMKTEPFQAYCNDRFGKGNYLTWLGMRADEPERLKVKSGIKYLADISEFDKQDVLDWWDTQDFDLELSCEADGNCLFCPKKSTPKLGYAIKNNYGQFLQMKMAINSKSVRDGHRKTTKEIMYRGHLSLDGIANMYKDESLEDMFNRLRSTKTFDTNSCSESCEPISSRAAVDFEYINSELLEEFEDSLNVEQLSLLSSASVMSAIENQYMIH